MLVSEACFIGDSLVFQITSYFFRSPYCGVAVYPILDVSFALQKLSPLYSRSFSV